MSEYVLPIMLGIVSSLVATGLFIALGEFLRKVVIPYWKDHTYSDIRVDGEWRLVVFGEGTPVTDDSVVSMSLKQYANKVSGTFWHKDKNSEEMAIYRLDGTIKSMYLHAMAVRESNRSLDGATFLLHIEDGKDGLQMRGGSLFQVAQGNVESQLNMIFKWVDTNQS